MLARFTCLIVVCLTLQACEAMPGLGLPDTPGAFIEAAQGETFEEMQTLDPRNAMIYIYRPPTTWGREEVQAPTFFLDGEQLFGLKAGGYSWLEVHAGSYDFYALRPMSILMLKQVFDLPMEVEGGRNYYFRYSELYPVVIEEIADNPETYMSDGPLQQVPEAFALRELEHLRLDQPGLYYGGTAYQEPRWAPFYSYETALPKN